jgi:hypothetical protein
MRTLETTRLTVDGYAQSTQSAEKSLLSGVENF